MRKVRAAALVIGVLALPASAEAATTVGSSLRVRANLFVRCNTECTAVQSARPGGAGLVIPQDGVITRWRVRAATQGTIRLRIVRREDDGGYSSVTIAPAVTLDRAHRPGQDVLYQFPARIPVRAGDMIGVDRDAKAGGIFHSYGTNTAYAVADFAPRLTDTASDVQPSAGSAGQELLLNVDVEKDADGDGFGDESQDNCPTIPNDQTAKPCTTPTPTPTGPTSTPIGTTTPPPHQQGSEGPTVHGERGPARGTGRHRGPSRARPRPPRASDPQRRHPPALRPQPRPRPRSTGPDGSPHDMSPPARPQPPSSNAPPAGQHDSNPPSRRKPSAQHKPTRTHDTAPNPRPNPPATEPQGGEPHDQSGVPRPAPRANQHRRVRRHRRHGSRPAPPPAQGAPGWQPH